MQAIIAIASLPLFFIASAALFVLPLLCAHDLYMKFVPVDRRTPEGPEWLKIGLCVVCWSAAALLIDVVT